MMRCDFPFLYNHIDIVILKSIDFFLGRYSSKILLDNGSKNGVVADMGIVAEIYLRKVNVIAVLITLRKATTVFAI